MIGRADIEGSKSNVAMNAWLPQASYPCGNFSDTSSFEFRSRIPLVRTSSELAVRRAGKAPEGTVPSPSPGRHAATRSRRGSSSSSPPTADGFGTGTPVPSPQSQSFSRSYGSILPTSLAYIVPSTRGCSPWRPDAVMSTTGRGRHSVLRIFKGRRERTGHHATCGALPAAGPYLRLSRFQDERFARQYRCGPPPEFPLASPRSGIVHHLSGPDRHSSPSFGSRQVCSHSNPSQKIEVGRRCTPRGDPTSQLPCALRVYSPVDSHTCQTPWSVFQDGSNGEPTGQRPERADAEARRRRTLPATIEDTTFHDRIESPSFGGPARRHSTSDRGASSAPICFPPNNFKHSLTLFSKSFSSFPRGTSSLSVSRPYLALDGIHRPIWAAFPNNPTRRQRLVVRQGLGTTWLSSSLAPPSRGLGPGFYNDLSPGSPTKTLLRLLLPLNDKVQWTSRDVAGSEPSTSPRSEHFTGSFNR
ncbi:Protein TAR1 [Capsicum annuum]|uniref:Protein TAR1 n=1 Tax=Capsicum annuum TaxID=4072 RepID=A0A2G2XVC0_CAPAN|nr:Protein TAR1 [Capsicum annuum]